ncbi:hypothetical protein FRAHR75_850019 [Frankia sp. Hr75.2]|nr:hypothetical protein FRAHR75_850019 [Frankia sp. Hr75.2]
MVRDPARHRDLPFDIRVVAGDVTDAVSAERAAAGRDAAVSAAADLSVPAHDFFTASSRALATGLAKAGARHLAVVGLSSVLPGGIRRCVDGRARLPERVPFLLPRPPGGPRRAVGPASSTGRTSQQ